MGGASHLHANIFGQPPDPISLDPSSNKMGSGVTGTSKGVSRIHLLSSSTQFRDGRNIFQQLPKLSQMRVFSTMSSPRSFARFLASKVEAQRNVQRLDSLILFASKDV